MASRALSTSFSYSVRKICSSVGGRVGKKPLRWFSFSWSSSCFLGLRAAPGFQGTAKGFSLELRGSSGSLRGELASLFPFFLGKTGVENLDHSHSPPAGMRTALGLSSKLELNLLDDKLGLLASASMDLKREKEGVNSGIPGTDLTLEAECLRGGWIVGSKDGFFACSLGRGLLTGLLCVIKLAPHPVQVSHCTAPIERGGGRTASSLKTAESGPSGDNI